MNYVVYVFGFSVVRTKPHITLTITAQWMVNTSWYSKYCFVYIQSNDILLSSKEEMLTLGWIDQVAFFRGISGIYA